jgi:hypothetical protein
MLATALVNLAPAVAQAPKKAVASPALQKEFDGFIEKFRAALRTNDSAAVAGMTRLPFMNDSAIRDAAQFRAKTYPTSFTAKNRACIQRGKAVYDRDGKTMQLLHLLWRRHLPLHQGACGVPFYGSRRE